MVGAGDLCIGKPDLLVSMQANGNVAASGSHIFGSRSQAHGRTLMGVVVEGADVA